MSERHVTMKHVGGHHSGEVNRIFRTTELRCVAKLGFFEVVNRRSHLDRHGQSADPLVHCWAVFAQRLRPKHLPVGLAEEEFHCDELRARIVPGV